MKTVFIVIIVFIIGFVLAKNLYETNDKEKEQIEMEESYEDTATETNKEEVNIPKSDNQQTQLNDETAKPKIKDLNNSENYNDTDGFVTDEKLKNYEKQLKSLDDKINSDLGRLSDGDTKDTEALVKEINTKPEGLQPGDDEHTEKEYQE